LTDFNAEINTAAFHLKETQKTENDAPKTAENEYVFYGEKAKTNAVLAIDASETLELHAEFEKAEDLRCRVAARGYWVAGNCFENAARLAPKYETQVQADAYTKDAISCFRSSANLREHCGDNLFEDGQLGGALQEYARARAALAQLIKLEATENNQGQLQKIVKKGKLMTTLIFGSGAEKQKVIEEAQETGGSDAK
jgi:hypothetical protein